MKRKIMFVAIILILAIGARCTYVTKESAVVAKAETPAQPAKSIQSVQEISAQYADRDLTPSQKRLVEAGFYPDRVHELITTKK